MCVISWILEVLDKHVWLPTFFTIISTIGLAVWQINRQFAITINSQRVNKLEELRVQIYKEIGEKIEVCQAAFSKSHATTVAVTSLIELNCYQNSKARAAGLIEPRCNIFHRYLVITTEHADAMQKLIEVIGVMDKYEIAFTDFTTMKMHILETTRHLRDAMSEFHNFILPYLPMDVLEEDREKVGGAKVTNPLIPDATILTHIKTLAERAADLNMDVASYLHDLRIEAQNVLLSPIFNNKKAPKRIPGDPRYQVLTLDPKTRTDKTATA